MRFVSSARMRFVLAACLVAPALAGLATAQGGPPHLTDDTGTRAIRDQPRLDLREERGLPLPRAPAGRRELRHRRTRTAQVRGSVGLRRRARRRDAERPRQLAPRLQVALPGRARSRPVALGLSAARVREPGLARKRTRPRRGGAALVLPGIPRTSRSPSRPQMSKPQVEPVGIDPRRDSRIWTSIAPKKCFRNAATRPKTASQSPHASQSVRFF